jgi:transposase
MIVPHEPDEIKPHHPAKCMACPHFAECVANGSVFSCGESRYVVDTVVSTRVTEHQLIKTSSCPYGEAELTGTFPENVKAYVQYGDSVTVLVGLLNTYGAVSVNRIHTVLGSLFGINLSTGVIPSMVARCAAKVGDTMDKIRTILAGGDIGNFDETGAYVGGKLMWVHNSSNSEYTYQTVSTKRGKQGMDENGVLPMFGGVAMHDCWTSYWKYEGIRHAICNGHLLRELTGIEENNPDHTWPTEFKRLLLYEKAAKEKAISKGEDKLSYYYLHKFDTEYDRIMELANTQCPPPEPSPVKKRGRKRRGKERALIERLIERKASVCMFAYDFNVPFDNNQAERDVRNVKTKVKVAGCFRSVKGTQDYLSVMSYLSTGTKHGVSVFEALTSAFAGNSDIVLQY